MTDAVTYEFEVTTAAPPSRRQGGKGRPRTNPFDAPVLESFREKFEDQVSAEAPEGLWYRYPGSLDETEKGKVEAQIRSAGHHHKSNGEAIRTEVRWDPDTGILTFRGSRKEEPAPKAQPEDNPEGTVESDAVGNDGSDNSGDRVEDEEF